MESTTQERALSAVDDPTDEETEPGTETPETETPAAPDPGEGETPTSPGDDGPEPGDDAESEEAARQQEEAAEKARVEAAKALSVRVGGIAPTAARIQITGGAIEIPPGMFPEKDDELEITVKGWVKTDKSTTETKGASAVREAVFVVEEITALTNNGRAQMQLGEDE